MTSAFQRLSQGRSDPAASGDDEVHADTVHRRCSRTPRGGADAATSSRRGLYHVRVSELGPSIKRVLLGRPMRSESGERALLSKRIALPVFASDALSSVAYAPDEILLTLSVAGMAGVLVSPYIGLVVVAVLVVVVLSYRQNVHAYPSGGGDYEVVTANLGRRWGIVVASALLVDYVLTVAVSISSGTQYVISLLPGLDGHAVTIAVGLVVLLALANLRGLRESGRMFAIPVYLFIGLIALTVVTGGVQSLLGHLGSAPSAGFDVASPPSAGDALTGAAGAFLLARAFASGCTALTGVEAISNGVPSFRPPKSKNAAITLALLGTISASMLMSILVLAQATGAKYVDSPAAQLLQDGGPIPSSYVQAPLIGQVAQAVFTGIPQLSAAVSIVTGFILVLAANTAFNGFPVLASILARDGYLPKQLHTRGDRLTFSNGIIVLASLAGLLIWAFGARVTALIQLYVVGVFVSFTLSQLGMVLHWTKALRLEQDGRARARMIRSRIVNVIGFVMTGAVLAIVLVTKFVHGAYISVIAMGVLVALMLSIRRHYDSVREELAVDPDDPEDRAMPSRVHAIVLVSDLHKPTLRALAYARASRPSSIEAVNVGVDPDAIATLVRDWERMDVSVPLRVLDSPYREITRPVISYVRSLRRKSPRDLVTVYVPEYVVGHWWEQLLHNQSALRIKTRLLFTPGVIVSSVPWQLRSSAGQTGLEDVPVAPIRRGY